MTVRKSLLVLVLVLVVAVEEYAGATPLDAIKPGEATVSSMREALGMPVERADNPDFPMEGYAAPGEGIESVTAWYNPRFTLRWARVSFVNKYDSDTTALLFGVRSQLESVEGSTFTEATEGRTDHYSGDGVHFYVVDDLVSEVWLTEPLEDIAAVKAGLAQYSEKAKMVALPSPAEPAVEEGAAEREEAPTEPVGGEDPSAVQTDLQEEGPQPSLPALTEPALPVPPDAGPTEPVPPVAPPGEEVQGAPPAEPLVSEAAPEAQAEKPTAWLGIEIQDLDPDSALRLRLAGKSGALVRGVSPGGPAAEAGLAADDLVTGIDGSPISRAEGLVRTVGRSEPGTQIRLDFIRRGKAGSVTVRLAAKPAQEEKPSRPGWVGASVRSVSFSELTGLGLKSVEGALVTAVQRGGPAEKAGIREGDFIVSWQGRKIAGGDVLARLVGSSPPGTSVKVDLMRGGRPLTLSLVTAEKPR